MGMSVQAKIAWGISFGDRNNDSDVFKPAVDTYDFERDVMPGLFGFTEEAPAYPAEGKDWGRDERMNWRETVRIPWEQRLGNAVPLTFVCYGYEFAGTALVLKRSLTEVEWSSVTVDPVTLAPPAEDELTALGMIASRVGCEGRPVSLLLMAFYG